MARCGVGAVGSADDAAASGVRSAVFSELASAFEETARRQGTEETAQGKGGMEGQSMVEWEEEMRRWWWEHRKWWAAAFGRRQWR